MKTDGTVALLKELAKFASLTSLDLAYNGIGPAGCKEIAQFAKTHPTLLKLNLGTGRVFVRMPKNCGAFFNTNVQKRQVEMELE